MIDDPLYAFDCGLICAFPLFVQHTDTDQVNTRSDAVPFAVCAGLAVGNDARDMRAVTIGVNGGLVPFIHQIHPGHQTTLTAICSVQQSALIADAGIQNGNRHALAGDPLRPNAVGAGGIGIIGGR